MCEEGWCCTKTKDDDKEERWRFSAARFVYQATLDLPMVVEFYGDKIKEYILAHEFGTHHHTDWFLVFHKAQDWTTLDSATIEGNKPHASLNTSRSSGYRTSCNRGHFYNQCIGNKGTTTRLTNFVHGEDYGVKTQWVLDLYLQNKLDAPLAAAGVYKCVTPALEAQVNRSSVHANSVAREEYKRTHAAALLDMKLPYRTTCEDIDAINAWYEQYKSIQWRYKALVLWGSSQLAKTEYIKDRFPGVYIHKSVINWSTYNPAVHPAILFDDVCVDFGA